MRRQVVWVWAIAWRVGHIRTGWARLGRLVDVSEWETLSGRRRGEWLRWRPMVFDVEAFASHDCVELAEIEAIGHKFPEKRFTLGELAFEFVGMAARCQCLSMAVFLVADYSSSCTRAASRVLRIALEENSKVGGGKE